MSKVIDSVNGAQILPDVRDQQAEVTAWVAQQCIGADQRSKYAVYADMARRLAVVA